MAMPLAAQPATQPGLPPGPTWPMLIQAGLWEARFPEFNGWLNRRYGNLFTVKLPFSGSVVSVVEPDIIRTLFADRGERTHAREANSILEPIMGRHSVLLLDGPEHTATSGPSSPGPTSSGVEQSSTRPSSRRCGSAAPPGTWRTATTSSRC